MQSFHRSRGRIFFEVLCAFAVSASCVGAWMQTGATALLFAAAVALLYGLVHAFDMAGRRSPVAVASRPAEAAMDEPTLAFDQPQTVAEPVVEDKPEPVAPRPTRARRAKSAPKAGRSRTKAREQKVAEPAPVEETMIPELVLPAEPEVTEPDPPQEPQVVRLTPPEAVPPPAAPVREETPPIPLTPLFEPQPFVRQQRGAFGRKAG